MADFNALTAKYQPVIDTIKSFEAHGATLTGYDLAGEQFHIIASVPSKAVENRVWDVIKQCDPTYADLKLEMTNTGGDASTYTIQPGDNLSKVSKLFYGTPNKYEAIARASNIDNPDKIQVGQTVTVPAL